ncbi:hypothetical protein [Sphingosinicella sp. CPCC 101087]|uniref:hypothetical protein n=1 Tax=Sphingosinicella sp. CPCC 101087 TaxID=2497754 RepID=UPI00101D1D39|nr:hypothetical protein [Sphingosinicella sp. CPCC 101087]
MKFVLVVASAVMLPSIAVAQNAGSTAQAPSGQASSTPGRAQSRDEERVCRRIQADTGSRLSDNRRVCMTRREWREYDRNN